MPFDCPACGKENKDDAKACHWCPESFPDEDDELRKPKFKRIDPGTWPIYYWVLIFMGIGFAIWRGFAYIAMTLDKGVRSPMARYVKHSTSVDDILDPNQQSKNKLNTTLEIILGTAPPSALADARAMRKGSTSGGAAVPDHAEEGEWLLKGFVYDLVTLKPIGDCPMVFSGGDKRIKTTTDGGGHYGLTVPIYEHGGYDVLIQCPDYARSYLNPGTEKVRDMPADDRKDLARDLNKSTDGPYQVEGIGTAPLMTDFYVAPKSAAGPND